MVVPPDIVNLILLPISFVYGPDCYPLPQQDFIPYFIKEWLAHLAKEAHCHTKVRCALVVRVSHEVSIRSTIGMCKIKLNDESLVPKP